MTRVRPEIVVGAELGLATAAVGISANVLGGAVPHLELMVGTAALLACAGGIVADRPRSVLATLSALAAVQLTLQLVTVLPTGLWHTPTSQAAPGLHQAPTVVGHLATAVVIGLLLFRTDAGVPAVPEWVRRLLLPLRVTPAVGTPLWVSVESPSPLGRDREVLLRRTRARRGPPLLG